MIPHPTPDEITDLRRSYGLTQTEAARLIYSSLRAWQQWEGAQRQMHPGLFELFRIKVRQIP